MIKDRWSHIRDLLLQDIENGVLEPGARLPTEQELAQSFGVGRHSIRRALAEMARGGHISIEQGRGTFVLARPQIEYTIGRRTRLRRNLSAQGVDVTGDPLGSERIPAAGDAAARLGLGDGDEMIVTRRITRADGLPLAFGALYHDAARFADFPERRVVLGSVSEAYKSFGIADYLRGRTSVHARPAKPEEAKLLLQHPDLPVMVVRAVDTLKDGTPIAFSEVIWSASRVTFSFASEET